VEKDRKKYLQDMTQAFPKRGKFDSKKKVNISLPERYWLYLKDIPVSYNKLLENFIREVLEAAGVNLRRPHDKEHWGHDDDGTASKKPLTWGEARAKGLAGETDAYIGKSTDEIEAEAGGAAGAQL
jgi:hypothetical protein